MIKDVECLTIEYYDNIINAEVLTPVGYMELQCKVTKRVRVTDVQTIGIWYNKPFNKIQMYEVINPDGSTCELTYNAISKIIFTQCDTQGRQYKIIYEILDHNLNETDIQKSN